MCSLFGMTSTTASAPVSLDPMNEPREASSMPHDELFSLIERVRGRRRGSLDILVDGCGSRIGVFDVFHESWTWFETGHIV
jgi:hypothetical protein